jgi:hypothetical protein
MWASPGSITGRPSRAYAAARDRIGHTSIGEPMLAEELLPLYHHLVMNIIPRRTGDDERDLLAAYTMVYQCAGSPEAYALFARQCDARSRIRGAPTDVTNSYRRLAQLARWRAHGMERSS